jgi:hypothetical protein
MPRLRDLAAQRAGRRAMRRAVPMLEPRRRLARQHPRRRPARDGIEVDVRLGDEALAEQADQQRQHDRQPSPVATGARGPPEPAGRRDHPVKGFGARHPAGIDPSSWDSERARALSDGTRDMM